MATILEAVAADGAVQRLPMSAAGQTTVAAEPGYRYRLVDDAGGRVAASTQIKRIGGDLVVEGLEQDRSVVLEGFFTRCAPANDCALSLENLGGTPADAIVPATAPIGALSGGGFLMYASGSAAPALPAPPEAGFDFKPILGVAGGLAIVGGAGGGGGGGGGGSSDSTPPGAPVITSGTFTNKLNPLFTGTAEPGATVTLTLANGAATYATTVAPDGTWRIDTATTSPTTGTLPALVEGVPIPMVARATDAAGNGSTLTSTTVTLDTAPPDAPMITSALLTNDATPTIRGAEAEPGARIELGLDLDRNGSVDVVYVTTANNAGAWVVEVGTQPPTSGTLPGGQLGDVSTTDLHVRQFDAAGNASPLVTPTPVLTVDVRIPDAPVIDPVTGDNAIDAAEAGGPVTITGTLPTGHVDRPVTVTWGGITQSTTATGPNWSVTFAEVPPDGTPPLVASFTNTVGTQSAEGTPETDVRIDRVPPGPPTISDEVEGTAGSGPITFTFTFGEPVRGFTASDVAVNNGSKGAFTGTDGDSVYTLVVTPTAGSEGDVTVSVPPGAFADLVGNPNTAGTGPYTQPFDAKPPTIAITDNVPGTAVGDITYTFTFSEPVSGFAAGDITVSNGSKGAFTGVDGSTVYTLVVTPTAGAQGTIGVSVAGGAALDAVGNPSVAATAAAQLFDRLPPALDITDNGGATASGPVTFTFTFSEPVTGFAADDVVVTGVPPGSVGSLTGSGAVYHLIVTPPTDTIGAINVSVGAGAASDGAGNPSGADSASRPFDTNVPPTLDITDNAPGTATGAVTFTFTFNEPVSGFSANDIQVDNGTKGAFNPVSASVYTLVVNPTPDISGEITVTVAPGAAQDGGGNGSLGASATQAFDVRVPPTVEITDDTEGVANGLVTYTFQFSEPVAAGFTVGDVDITNGTGVLTPVDGDTYTLAVTPTANTSGNLLVLLPAGSVSDLAGNPNAEASALPQPYDLEPPLAPTVSIDGVPNGGVTLDRTPTLVLTFDELFGTGYSVQILRNGMERSDPPPPTPTGTSSATYEDQITLAGEYTYTARMTDAAGNIGALSDPYTIQVPFVP